MLKVYALVSALILFALLMFSPLFSLNTSTGDVAVSWNTSTVQNWTAGPGSWD